MAAIHHRRIEPKLDPPSDKKFFGPPFPADYPDDSRPASKISKDFTHPFPDVQASTAYDEDFVKDENGDNGEWKAQADYDLIRLKEKKEEKDVVSAAEHEAEKKKEFEEAKKVFEEAEKKFKSAQKDKTESEEEVDEAEKQEEDAKSQQKKAEEEADEAEKAAEKAAAQAGSNETVPFADTVEDAKKIVEDKAENLKGCEKQLEDAQKQLADLEEKQKIAKEEGAEAAEKAVKEKKEHATKAQQDADELLKDAKEHKASAEKQMASASEGKSAAQKEYDAAAKAAADAESAHKAAEQAHDKEVADVESTKAKLTEAEDRLRGHRQSSVHQSAAPAILMSHIAMGLSVAACLF